MSISETLTLIDINPDSTRLALSEATDSEATRIAPNARRVDLETEGTRIRATPAASLIKATEHEIAERYQIGEKIDDRYEVLAIHRGTMGVVYGTFDHKEMLPRALKTLQQRYASDKGMQDLFAAEAMTWVKLEKHPFIVRAYLVQKFENQPYVITEYIRGQENMGGDLRAWLGHPNLKLPIAVEMALQIAQGMQHANCKVPGLVHRDLKPANILVDERARAMVTDFGLVHADDTSAGTPAYMAPEQWRAETLDARTDIYAYGCILYEMFTGHRMFAASREGEWEIAHLGQAPVAPIALNSHLPQRISDFISQCIAKQRTHRPTDWDEVVLECAHWFHEITGQPVVFDFSENALSAEELLNASYSLSTLEKYPEMLAVCDRILAIDQNYLSAWHNKILALQQLNRLEEALTVAEQALAIDPHSVGVWGRKGSTLITLKRYEEALVACDEALAIDSSYVLAWYGKCDALTGLNRHDEATAAFDRGNAIHTLAECEQSLALNPNNAHAWNSKGSVLASLERHEEAVLAFDRALSEYSQTLAIDPNDLFT